MCRPLAGSARRPWHEEEVGGEGVGGQAEAMNNGVGGVKQGGSGSRGR